MNIEVDAAVEMERSGKIDNKIIVFHSLVLFLLPLLLRMLNQPKNVFSIKLFFWDFTFDRETFLFLRI